MAKTASATTTNRNTTRTTSTRRTNPDAALFTKRDFAAKCRAITKADSSEGDLMVLAVMLGRDAERLGIAKVITDFILSSALHWLKKASARVDMVEDEFAAMLHVYAGENDTERAAAR